MGHLRRVKIDLSTYVQRTRHSHTMPYIHRQPFNNPSIKQTIRQPNPSIIAVLVSMRQPTALAAYATDICIPTSSSCSGMNSIAIAQRNNKRAYCTRSNQTLPSALFRMNESSNSSKHNSSSQKETECNWKTKGFQEAGRDGNYIPKSNRARCGRYDTMENSKD